MANEQLSLDLFDLRPCSIKGKTAEYDEGYNAYRSDKVNDYANRTDPDGIRAKLDWIEGYKDAYNDIRTT